MKYNTIILDDNEVDASLLSEYLKKSSLKYNVKLITDGVEFEEAVHTFQPDLIISDYRLNRYTGLNALNYRNEHCRHVPFIIVSGQIGEEKAAGLINQGATYYVMKNNAESSLALVVERGIRELEEERRAKELEIVARQHQMLLEIITNQAEIPVWIRDKEGKFYYINNKFRELFHLEDIKVFGKRNQDLFDDELARQFDDNDRRAKEENKLLLIEESVSTKRGIRFYQTCLFPLHELPELEGSIAGIATDITHQKSAELDLQKALEEKSHLLESIGEAFFSIDNDWNIHYWNKSAEELTGLQRDKVLGKNLWDFLSKSDGHNIYDELHNAWKTQKSTQFEECYKPKNLYLDISAHPKDQMMSVFIRDITEKRDSEKLIRQAYERFEKVTEATSDAIWDWDLKSETLHWGGGFKSLFGYDLEMISTKLDSWTDHIHIDDEKRVMDSFYAALDDPNQTKWISEYRYFKQDGSYAFVMDRALILRDENGNAERVIGAMTDITFQKEYEMNLQQLNEKLQRYTQELEKSNIELEQFAYVASHDLQEPLRMITSFMDILKNKYGDKLDDKALEYIYYATDGAKKMKRVILDLLAFSRVGKNEDKMEKIDIAELVNFVIQMQQKLIKETGAEIKVKKLPALVSYRAPLVQVFQNLIENALKYSRDGVKPKIIIQSKETEREWIISVEDNGIGIDPDYYDKIFIIFQRLEPENRFGGTGMGLSVVKKIVENMGGRIWVESEVGRGSTFYFTILKKD